MAIIKILVAAHKLYWMPNDSVYMPIHVGREGKADLGYVGDNTGDNISAKNPNYCELTALYWAWKNLEADYVGLVHYRRYFTNKEVRNIEGKKQQVLTSEQWQNLLETYPVVVGDKRRYYIENNRSHYNHAHHSEGLDVTETIIAEMYPEYSEAFTTVCNRTWAHMFNMFVMRRDLYNQYCEWLFDILFKLEKRVDISGYDPMNPVSLALSVKFYSMFGLKKTQINYKEQNVSFMEKQNWLIKGGSFIGRKILSYIK